jgi:hypothetical protein
LDGDGRATGGGGDDDYDQAAGAEEEEEEEEERGGCGTTGARAKKPATVAALKGLRGAHKEVKKEVKTEESGHALTWFRKTQSSSQPPPEADTSRAMACDVDRVNTQALL